MQKVIKSENCVRLAQTVSKPLNDTYSKYTVSRSPLFFDKKVQYINIIA